MWVYDHHVRHHPHTNGPIKDTYTPFTKAEYDAMPQWRQWLERLYRGPNVIGWSLYYLVERWWDMKLFPRDHMPELHRKAAWQHFWFMLAYTGWGLYLQHTHPDATWLRGSNEENKAFYERGELLAVHWVMPRWFGRL